MLLRAGKSALVHDGADGDQSGINLIIVESVRGEHVMSTDEKTSIQALERVAPTKPAVPGRIESVEFEYIRHGTLCLMPSFNVATGVIDALRPAPPAPSRTLPATSPRPSTPTPQERGLVLAESGGDLVQRAAAPTSPAEQLQVVGRTSAGDREVHRLLQRGARQAVPLNLPESGL